MDTVHSLFKQHQYNPPVFKNQPPVAGAIAWERSLFNRIKHTIMRFQNMEDMMNSEYGKAVSICAYFCDCVVYRYNWCIA